MFVDLSEKHQPLFDCLSSPTRLAILRLMTRGPLSTTEIASLLPLSKSIVSRHLTMLEACGLVKHMEVKGIRGLRKVYTLCEQTVTLNLSLGQEMDAGPEHKRLPIGQYEACEVSQPCGLSQGEEIIGISNEPRYFLCPESAAADKLWFGQGELRYPLPFTVRQMGEAMCLHIRLKVGCVRSDKASRTGELLLSIGDELLGALPVKEMDIQADGVAPEAVVEIRADGVHTEDGALSSVSLRQLAGQQLVLEWGLVNRGMILYLTDAIEFELLR